MTGPRAVNPEPVRLAAGLVQALWPRTSGFGPGRIGTAAGRVLGLRHLVSAVALDGASARGHLIGAGVDLVHAASLVVVRAPAGTVLRALGWAGLEVAWARTLRRSPRA